MKKRCFALLLALIMLVSVFPVGVVAQETDSEGKNEEVVSSDGIDESSAVLTEGESEEEPDLTEEEPEKEPDLTEEEPKEEPDLTEEEPEEEPYIKTYRELKEAGDEEALEAFMQSLTDEQREHLETLTTEEEEAEEAPAEPVEAEEESPENDEDEDEDETEPRELVLSAAVDDVIVTLTAEQGAFGDIVPEELALSVRKIEDTAEEAEKIEEAVSENRDSNATPVVSYKFDITVQDKDGNELQPVEGAVVRVSFALAEVMDSNLDVSVYHVTDEQSETLTAEELDAEEQVPDEESGGEGTVITVETDGFSYYVVEFTYNSLEYVLQGDESVKLSEILAALNLTGTVEYAQSSNTELFSVEKDAEGDDWTVTALKPFSSEEQLKVGIGGIEYIITVTDDTTAPGTRQQITKEALDDGAFYVYHAVENGVTLTLYCFNSELVWPVTGNPDLTDYYVPDEMLTLSEDVKDKVYRIMYAGYPHNNLGLYSSGDEPITYSELADAVVPPQAVMDLLQSYDWDNLSFTPENLVGGTAESAVMDELLWSMFDDECYAAMQTKPDFVYLMYAWQFGPYYTVDDLLEAYAGMKPTSSPGDVHDATQIAIWRILYENGVPNNGKPMTDELNRYPLAQQLVDFANGVGEYANADIPPRGTTISAMEAYKATFETGSMLLRADGSPVGAGGIIVFSENENGEYVSEPLHFADGTYALPYTITLSDGTAMLTNVINHGSGEFVLYSPSRSVSAQVNVETENHYPSDVYQYVVESQKDIKAEELSHDANHVQDMSGVYFQSVPMSLSFGTEFRDAVKTGSLTVSKTVEDAPADSEKEFSFTVTLSDNNISGTYGTMEFIDGVAAFTLKGGQSKHAAHLPAGITYTVVEDDYSSVGYTTGAFNDTGTIVAGETVEASFINAYKAASVKVSLSGTKTLEGGTLTENEFTFTVYGSKDGVTKEVKNDANGKIDFGTHEFTEAGTYTYTIKEVNDGKPGFTYDSKIYTITVEVTDDGEGQLIAELTGCAPEGNNIDFVNKYELGSTSVTLGGEKMFTGYPAGLTEPEFSFTLKEGETVLDTKTVTGSGEYEFTSIRYTTEGEHDYTVQETKGSQPGVNYDGYVYKLHVSVKKNDQAQLVATITGDSATGDDLNFGNSYKAAAAKVHLSGTKKLEGRDLAADEFSFTITGSKDGITKTVKNGTDGAIDFGTHEFTEAGTYTYTIKEVNDGKPGITYDSTIYTVTVTVTDDGSGQLQASLTGCTPDGKGLDFTNSFTLGSTSVIFGGEKRFDGFPEGLTPPQFHFLLIENGKSIDRQAVTGSGEYEFQPITYTAEGEHDYTVRELHSGLAGVNYDDYVYNLHVSVKQNDQAQLVATISGSSTTGDDLNFGNTYKAKSVTAQFSGTKTLEGQELKDGQFKFLITGLDDNYSREVTNEADGKIDFGTREFTKAGSYRYTVKEVNDGKPGITYDSKIYEFTVHVTDDGSGRLTALFSGDTLTGKGLDFTNSYETGSTSVTFGGKKTFTGFPKDSSIKPVFTFVLKEDGNEIERRSVEMEGDYLFSSITYSSITYDKAGEHHYTVEEILGDQAGVTYDRKVYKLDVSVTDNGLGRLVADITGDSTTGTDLNFTNSYKAAAVDLHIRGTKTLTDVKSSGKTLAKDEFSFQIIGLDDDTDITVKNDADGKIDFGKHSFTEAGTYRYKVHEVRGNEAGVTYDSTVYEFTVEVTDSGNGKLAANVSGNVSSESGFDFTNLYEAGSTSVTFGGKKTFEGFPENSEIHPVFTFTLSDGDDVLDTQTVTGSDDYAFAPITYDAIGNHTYTVREIPGGQAGVTYDDTVYTVNVSVTDNGGQLVATVTGVDSSDALDFTNSYEAEAVDLHIRGAKTLTGKDLTAEEFSFRIVGLNDDTDITVKNDTDGKIDFGKHSFTKAGTYTYKVSEVTGTEAGVTYDTTIYEFTVEVTDSGNGKLTASVSSDDVTSASGFNFENTYIAGSTSVNFGGTKTFEGFPDGAEKPVFTFTLKDGDTVLDTKTVKGSGEYAFDPITYTEEGEYTYTVLETDDDQAGVTYDDTVYTVTVSVADVDAQLVATVSGVSAADALNFTNSYEAKAAEVTFSGTKTLEGRPLAAEEFSFTLADADGKTIETVKNAADGAITFSKLTFAAPGVYHYTVSEEATSETGVTIDRNVYKITVTVTDSGSGELTAVISGDTDSGTDLNFVNKCKTGVLWISKTVTGNLGDKDKLFTFTVTFIGAPETYSYSIGDRSGTISSGGSLQLRHGEIAVISGLPEGAQYVVTESDNDGYKVYYTGNTGIISSVSTAAASFTNAKSTVPNTGDETRMMMWFVLMMSFFSVGAGTVLLDRRTRRYNGRHTR